MQSAGGGKTHEGGGENNIIFSDYFAAFQLYFKIIISTFHVSNLFLHPQKRTHTENWVVVESWWTVVVKIKFQKIQKIHCANPRSVLFVAVKTFGKASKQTVVLQQLVYKFLASKNIIF